MSSTRKDIAVRLAGLGYVLFPLLPGKKFPGEGMHWREMSTCDVKQVREWWSAYPDDNVGVDCGQSGLVVVDIDNEEARDTWDKLWFRYETDDWMDAGLWPVVRTPRGWHVYFDASQGDYHNTTGELGDGIDTRGVGGMVVGAGSVVSGRSYQLVSGHFNSVERVPEWLRPRLVREKTLRSMREASKPWRQPSLHKSHQQLKRWQRKIIQAQDGTQNNTINVAAHAMRDYIPPLELEYVVDELERACDEGGHPMYRAKATIRSGLGA